MRRWLRDNGLSVFFLVLFVVTLALQSLAGWRDVDAQQALHGEPGIGWWPYVTSSDFWQTVLENWQSEYLQFFLYVVATIYLVQRGSPESKPPGKEGRESDDEQRVGQHADAESPGWARTAGMRHFLYANSLALVFGAIFLGSWFGHSVTGWRMFNEDQRTHDAPTVSWPAYLEQPDFWETTFQNWQSEFLAVGTMVVFSIYLRQRGSPESKPVGAPHTATGVEG
jgi:hypothetical protein